MKKIEWTLTKRQLCDVELILNGGFSPLDGFVGQQDYESILNEMRLATGALWPIPIVLDVSEDVAPECGDIMILKDGEGIPVAELQVSDVWQPELKHEAEAVYGTIDKTHPGVHYLFHQSFPIYVGGKLKALKPIRHYDFVEHRHSPDALKAMFAERGWKRIVAFQTRNPMHRAHVALTQRAAAKANANLLIHPVVGMTKPGDIDHFCRVRCYEAVLKRFPEQTTMLSLLPLAMRMAGPREALWHAMIRKNYGCTHFIVGRDHAGPGKDTAGRPFYGPYDAQNLVQKYADEIEIEMVPFREMVYVSSRAEYRPVDEVTEDDQIESISGTEFRRRLQNDLPIPEWFSYPEVVKELRRTIRPRARQGYTVFFTGLSGAGKSTLANALMQKLLEIGGRSVTLLDGDIVRQNLSSELGFSKAHRDLNIRRIGFVAAEITKAGGVAICAPIAPYRETRRAVRKMVSEYGGFVEVYVSTPLEVCEARDPKGLYAKARAGLIKQFTGIDDPYEAPESPELSIDTSQETVLESVQRIILHLESEGYISA
ncbi:MAG: bifunctional sulfate adenylyltransferase/adenylylsulfate kinase [Gammaproteobacteria bacterium]|nr:MAG: bifunctional sulfate adenylyltransferase/adenylylsulfate kinase [Gammaproteobacteria bacterium]